jgi:hypothetical protein
MVNAGLAETFFQAMGWCTVLSSDKLDLFFF